jgi:hypothetical protein
MPGRRESLLTLEYDQSGARRVLYGLIALECVFVAAYVVIHILTPERAWGPLRPFLDLDNEKSLPTWFSVLQLFCVGALLLLVARNGDPGRGLSRTALRVAGLVFIGLSADEGIQIHEHLTYQSRSTALADTFIGRWSAWIVAYALLGLIGLALVWRPLYALWQHFRSVAVAGFAGAAIFVTGGVGFEIAGYPFRGSAETEAMLLTMTAFEEFFEMLGVSLMLYASLLLAARFSAAERAAPAAAVRQSFRSAREARPSSPA